jgi:hypothetical protein
MEALVQESRRHTGVVIIVQPTEKLRAWDGRFTNDYVRVDPCDWVRGSGRGILKDLVAEARSFDMPRMELPMQATGLLAHDEHKEVMYEGGPAHIILRRHDTKDMEWLQQYGRTKEYVDDDAHPSTNEQARRHKRATFIWRARANTLPSGQFVQNEFKMEDELGGVCTCGSPEDPEDETLEHIFVHCQQYEHLREPGTNSLRVALGYVSRSPGLADSNLDERKKRARNRMDAAWEIWCERNRIREKAKATLRQPL